MRHASSGCEKPIQVYVQTGFFSKHDFQKDTNFEDTPTVFYWYRRPPSLTVAIVTFARFGAKGRDELLHSFRFGAPFSSASVILKRHQRSNAIHARARARTLIELSQGRMVSKQKVIEMTTWLTLPAARRPEFHERNISDGDHPPGRRAGIHVCKSFDQSIGQ